MITDQEVNVLKAINNLETPTRAGIARFARLSTVSVTSVLGGLQRRRLIEQAGKTKSLGGRPSVIYRLAPEVGCSIGVQFEGTFCQLVAVDAAGGVLADFEVQLSLSTRPADHVNEILDQVTREVRRLIADPALQGRRVLCLGIAPPGMVDTERRIWLHGLRLSGIEHVELGAMLERALGTPVLVEDPARCMAHLAVTRMGREEAGDLLLLYLGSGVGAGLVHSGEIYRGNRGLAGELGHLVVEAHGERCGCGNAGCLETVASVPAILRRFQRRLQEGVISSLQELNTEGAQECLTLEAIGTAAAGGDRLALATLAEIGSSLGDACGTSIMMFNPRTLCIAGPVAVLGAYLEESLWSRIRHLVIPEMLTDLRLEMVASRTGDEALGAALLAARWFWERLAEEYASSFATPLAAREVFN